MVHTSYYLSEYAVNIHNSKMAELHFDDIMCNFFFFLEAPPTLVL